MIVVDTLRADHVSRYGGTAPTPNIDKLAAAGVLFKRTYAHAPITGPSHASMFTSLLPASHGVHNNAQLLNDSMLTLAEILRSRSWHTAAFVSLGVLSRQFGFQQGFDEYYDQLPGRWWKSANEVNANLIPWLKLNQLRPLFLWLHYSDPPSPYTPPDIVYPRVRIAQKGRPNRTISASSRPASLSIVLDPGQNDFELLPLEQVSSRPLACTGASVSEKSVRIDFPSGAQVVESFWGSPIILTLPATIRLLNSERAGKRVALTVTCKEQLSTHQMREMYGREVMYVDREIGRAIEMLRMQGLWDNSLIVFTSDHGEGLEKHGLMEHVEQLYDSLLRVPLIMVFPGRLPAGKIIDFPVRHVDVLPTILELLQIEAGQAMYGRSLVRLVGGHQEEGRRPVVAETSQPEAKFDQKALVVEGYKYILNESTGVEELYFLQDDPGEMNNLAATHVKRIGLMRQYMEKELAILRASGRGSPRDETLSEDDRERLRALGYVH